VIAIARMRDRIRTVAVKFFYITLVDFKTKRWPLFKDFSVNESFRKTGKLRTCSKITRPHLSLRQIRKMF